MSVRFAPSPTGAFHVGNFRTAWISRWWADTLKMPWVVRFEDIDRPRVIPGARERQLDEMRDLGLEANRVLLQSDNHSRHESVFEKFHTAGLVYPCFCSRQTVRRALAGAASAPHGKTPAYNGACRDLKTRPVTDLPTIAWRLKMPDVSGRDDFIVARTSPAFDESGRPVPGSFVPAYPWACAIDDFDEKHALLVRAWDLSDATVPQREIQKNLAELEGVPFAPPAVFHTALVTRDDGGRLEKRTRGVTLPELIARGETAASLVQKFTASFASAPRDFAPGKIFGESLRTMGLRELGLGRG